MTELERGGERLMDNAKAVPLGWGTQKIKKVVAEKMLE